MSWPPPTTNTPASGADDDVWAVWDLRNWKAAPTPGASSDPTTPVESFGFHKEQITSVEWHPTEDSIVAVAAGDDTLTLLDLAVELDEEARIY
jgi:ribosome assembly protein RRB1